MKRRAARLSLFLAILLTGLLILVLVGCTTPTAVPAETPPVIYQLDFEDPEAFSGWHVGGPGTDFLWLENTQNEKYVFEYPAGFLQNWDQSLGDVEISVDVEFHSDQPMDVSIGCRVSAEAGYWFNFTSGKHWIISKYFNGQSIALAEGDSDAILPDVNRLTARCEGANLTLLVNGMEAGSAVDRDILAGGISLSYNSFVAGSGSFDNLLVLNLTPATPTAAQGTDQTVLYSENFDDPSTLTGWEVKDGQAEVKDGVYSLRTQSSNMATFKRDQTFTDTTLTVDLEFLGPDPATASVICRNGDGGYSFSLSSEGHWKIDSSTRKLASGDTTNLVTGFNRLTVSCTGSQFTFSLNGAELGSVQDGDFPQGEIGFTLASDGQAEVAFDNLTVSGSAAPTMEVTPTSTPSLAPSPTLTTTPTLRPTLIPTGEQVLYQTDFENNDASLAQWRTFAYSFQSGTLGTEGYETLTNTSLYRFVASEINQRMFAIYDTDLGANVDISLHASVVPGGSVGLVCRYSEAGWYQFLVEPNGKWSVRLAQYDPAGQLHFREAASGTYWPGPSLDLRAECKSDTLNFYIDGVQQAMLHDSTFTAGKVGMLSWSFEQSGQTAMIERFAVRRASWSESNIPGPAATPGPDDILYTTDFGNLDALSQYWYEYTRVEALGPGSWRSTNYYINDFDPGTGNVEISTDVAGGSLTRSLICRYSPDGWYEAGLGHQPAGAYLGLARIEHDANGQLATTWLASRFVDTANVSKLTLTCTGSQLLVSVNDEPFVYTEDTLWQTGRYGFSYIGDTSITPRSAFTSYTVRTADRASVQPGDTILAIVSDTAQEIITDWNMNSSDDRLTVQDDSILLTLPPNIGIGLSNGIPAEDTELTVDLEFKGESGIHFDCRSESVAPISAHVWSNGDWGIMANGQVLASGNSADIHPEQNLFTVRCAGNQVTLIANEEVVSTTELSSYRPTSGQTGMFVENNFSVQLNSITFKVLQPSTSPLLATVLPNQVSLPVHDEPGAAIYTWNTWDFLGVAGHKDRAWVWVLWHEEGPSEQSNQIIVTPTEGLNVWTYRDQDLYDLPLEVSADVTFGSSSGGIGLMCRYTQLGRYEFLVQPDGKWFIRRNTSDWYTPSASRITILAQGTSDAIQPGANQLTVTCSGNELVFTANGTELGRVQDDLYPEGQVGIFFEPYTAGSFTNLSIWRGE